MRKGIAVAGNLLVDHIKVIDNYPEKGMLVGICEIMEAVGGCVCNTGTDLCLIDPALPVYGYGKVGRDAAGEFLKSRLSGVGMRIEGIRTVDTPTTFSDVMSEAETGDRTFFTYMGADAELTPEDFDPAALPCEIFHLGYIRLLRELDAPDPEYGTRLARLLARVQAEGIRTSVDVVSRVGDRFRETVMPALRYCDYTVFNEIEAGSTADIDARDADGTLRVDRIRTICERFFEMGVREAVILHAPEAGFAMTRDGTFTAVPSLDLPAGFIKGASGAGDAFCAGALYGLWRGDPPEEILRFASACAACNLSAPDAVSGMRSYPEIKALEARFGRKTL